MRDRIRAAAHQGDWTSALRIAASCPAAWGPWAPTIERAQQAGWNPGFSNQLGRSSASDIANGIAALRYLLNLNEETNVKTKTKPAAEKAARKPRRAARRLAAPPGDATPRRSPRPLLSPLSPSD